MDPRKWTRRYSPSPPSQSIPSPAMRRRARLIGYFAAAVLIGLGDHYLGCLPTLITEPAHVSEGAPTVDP